MELRFLVVDDEELIRDGVCRKIERMIPDAIIVGKAQDARQALEIVRESHPHIVITDIRMPETDGLKLIEMARQISPNTRYIVISGFEDFDYARTAIRLGVEDYLLKPIENDQLRTSIDKLKTKFEKELYTRTVLLDLKSKINRSMDFLRNKYLNDIVTYTNEFNINSTVKNLELMDITFSKPRFTVTDICISPQANPSSEFSEEDFPLLCYAIRNIAEEILSQAGTVLSFESTRHHRHIGLILNHDLGGLTPGPAGFRPLYDKIILMVNKYLKTGISIGIGQECASILEIPAAYLEAYGASMQKIIQGENRVIYSTDIPDSARLTFFLPDESRILLFSCIKEGNFKKAGEIIDKIFQTVRDNKVSFDNIRLLCLDLFLQFNKMLKEAGGSWDKVFSRDLFSEAFLLQFNTLDELIAWIKDSVFLICEYIIRLTKTPGKKVIDEIREYIHNYYYTDINLNDLAARYFLNPNYLCQLFKLEAGQNFTDYLTQIRMEKAKTLLRETGLKSYAIAEMVGYNNSRYFSDVFQRYAGVTPTEYRQQSNRDK